MAADFKSKAGKEVFSSEAGAEVKSSPFKDQLSQLRQTLEHHEKVAGIELESASSPERANLRFEAKLEASDIDRGALEKWGAAFDLDKEGVITLARQAEEDSQLS